MAKSKRNTDSNSPVQLEGIKSRTITHEDGTLLEDKELIRLALDSIDDHVKATGEPSNVDPQFIEWMREAVEAEDIIAHKKATVVKQTMNFLNK